MSLPQLGCPPRPTHTLQAARAQPYCGQSPSTCWMCPLSGVGALGPPPGHQGPELPAGLKEPLWTPQFPFLLWPPGILESDASFTYSDSVGLYVLHLCNDPRPPPPSILIYLSFVLRFVFKFIFYLFIVCGSYKAH